MYYAPLSRCFLLCVREHIFLIDRFLFPSRGCMELLHCVISFFACVSVLWCHIYEEICVNSILAYKKVHHRNLHFTEGEMNWFKWFWFSWKIEYSWDKCEFNSFIKGNGVETRKNTNILFPYVFIMKKSTKNNRPFKSFTGCYISKFV